MKPSILLPAEAPNVYIATRMYAAMGLSVLPCEGKKPALSQWAHLQKRIALTPTIDLWHKTGLLENVGIICGDVSNGLVVMDLDGDAAINTFLDRFPGIWNTYSVTSGSGKGKHLYYYVGDVPPTTRVTQLEIGNIELRSNGSYVVAPPSIHPDTGNHYTIDQPIEIMYLASMRPIVEWIKSLIKQKHGGQMPPPSNHRVIHSTAYGRAALRGEANEVASALPGERNNRLYHAALKMGSLIADGKIDRSTVETSLLDAARGLSETDGQAATERTIASGINQGLESSRERFNHA